MKNILRNCLFTPGTKIRVKGRTKHRAPAPGSTCFMMQYAGLPGPSPNMALIQLILTKNGKRGKDRVERLDIVSTVFPIEFEKRPLRSNKYKRTPVVELESVPMDIASVVDLEPMDFIGWAYSYKMYMRALYSNAGIAGKWPQGKGQPVNAFRHVSARMHKTPKEIIELLSTAGFRMAFTEQLRALEASVIQRVLEDKLRLARIRLKALAYLIWTDKNYKKKFYDLEQLKNNYSHHQVLFEAEQNLYHQINMKRWSSLPARKRKNLPAPKKQKTSATVESVIDHITHAIKNGDKMSYDYIVFPNDKVLAADPAQHYGGEMFEIQEA